MNKPVHDDRRKLDAILAELNKFKKRAVKVGVLSTAKKHKSEDGQTSEMAVIAATHEYGSPTKKIPERSWLRSWVDENKSKINAIILKTMQQVEDGELKAIPALKRLGVWAKGGIQTKIHEGPFESLKHREGTPLIDTAQFVNSINHEVVKR